MKTCEDCIHYHVCDIEVIRAIENIGAKLCHNFKDESKIIELPCSVGDTVYKIYYNRRACNDCDKFSSFYGMDPMCNDNKILFPEIGDDKKCICNKHHLKIVEYKADLSWIIGQLDQFGKSVFLTREEAEKKLEEINNGYFPQSSN